MLQSKQDSELVQRLLEIVSAEGLVHPSKLDPEARLEEIGLTEDDLVLVGNAIEREFDLDLPPDEAKQHQPNTLREWLETIGRRIDQRAAR